MLSNIQKNIILRAVEIRRGAGEDPEAILDSYSRLSYEERKEILEMITGQAG